jgi:PAS domain S-box-containing protein
MGYARTTDNPDWTLESEQALRASEHRFARAFYASPIAMAITTLADGRYVEVNEAFERQMGYARVEICGRTSLELGVWPSPGDRVAMVTRLERLNTLRDQSAQFRTKSGSLITTLYSASLITFDGRPCVLAAIADITAQKVAEDALRESESKFRMLAETTQSGIFICRPGGALCYFNPQVAAFTGYSSEELHSMTIWDIVQPDARGNGEHAPTRYETTITTKSGETRWIDFTTRSIDFQGGPAILGTAFDITDSKRNEQQAKEHTALLQTLVVNSPFGIMVGGRDHRIRFSNPAFQRIFQYAEEEVVGKDPDDLVGAPENSEATDFSRRVLSGEVVQATTVRRRKDGSKVNVELHAVPLISGNEFVGCFGIYQDITQRVESEAKLRALRDRLNRVQDEERAHIARELHDDIGQRLAVLAIQLAEVQKAARAKAPSLVDQLETSMRLTGEICADAHRLSYRLHPSQLAYLGLTRALSSFCEEFARQNRIEIDFKHDDMPALSPDVMTCLYRVAQEAIRNAEKHSDSRRVRLELKGSSESVRLCVSDSGRGFDATAGENSRGLGLMSMAERVRSVGGELLIRSQVDHGTRIEVSIPVPKHP